MSEPELLVECAKLPDNESPFAAKLLQLNECSPRPSPFFTPEYIRTYLTYNERQAREEVEPFVLLARSPGSREIVAALPLKRVWDRSQFLPFRRIEFIVGTEIDVPPLLAAPSEQLPAARAMLRGLAHLLHRASLIELIHQPCNSPLYLSIEAARAPWADVRLSKAMPISYIRPRHSGLDAYFGSLNHKMRSNVSRLARRLFSQGQLCYLTASEPGTTADLFEVYLDVEDRSWKLGTDASLRRHPVRVEMYRRLLRGCGKVRYHIDVLLLNEVPIAAHLSMQFHRTIFAMETCYDEKYGADGPGNLMLLLAVHRALQLRVSELSLHGHFEYYKHRWLAETVETNDVRILRRGSIPHARAIGGAALRKIRGEADRRVGIPLGQPERAPRNSSDQSPPRSIALVAKLRSSSLVTRLEDGALRAVLPFSTAP